MISFLQSIHPALTPGFFFLFLLCALITGMAKAGLSGIGLSVVPMMALIFHAKESTGVLLPMLIAADIMAVIYYKQHAVWKYILRVLPWVAAGITIAVITGNRIDNEKFRILLLTVVWIMLIIMVINDIRKKSGNEIHGKQFFAPVMGTMGGFSTMIGNAAGPVFTLYFLAMKLPKNGFIGTGAWLYLLMNVGKLPLQAFVWENINRNSLMAGLVSFPFIVLGIFIGIRIVKLLPERVFRIFIIIATLLTSLLLFI